MTKVMKIAYRNLLRYSRRTLLTSILIVIGIAAVLLFVSIAGSFKQLMVGQITDSMLGHLQIHRQGFLASIDNAPLNLNLTAKQLKKVDEVLSDNSSVSAFSARLKFSGMLSSYSETSNMRINAIKPEAELKTVPMLVDRVNVGAENKGNVTLKPGEIWIPETLAKGMKLNLGDQVVLVATNKDGSVNGISLIISGIVASMTGPGGRDGYLNIADGYELLRIEENEANELAVRLSDFKLIEPVYDSLINELSGIVNQKGKPVFEIHTWEKLSPFSSIADIIDIMTIFVKIILIAIVLVSIMNVMLMAVYERIREIGTIAAIGTIPRRIWSLFLMEGLFLGVFGAAIGTIISLLTIQILNWTHMTISFGRNKDMLLSPTIATSEVITTVLIVIFISGLASLQPAIKASRLEPVDALRHV